MCGSQGSDKSLVNRLLMLCADMHAKNGDENKAIEMLEKLVVGGNKVGNGSSCAREAASCDGARVESLHAK